MDFYEAARQRRTIRDFSAERVPEAALKRALETGLMAPCNAHQKSWQFVLLRDREKHARAVVYALKTRDLKDGAEIERFVGRFDSETLKRVYRKALPRQLSMMLEAPELLVVCYAAKPLDDCRS